MSNLRGEGHHQAECRAGDFTPGTPVRLVREPDNPHDPNAVAVHDHHRDGVAAYLDGTRAKAVSKVLDSGRPLAAVSTCGTRAGQPCEGITVVAASPDVLAHLLSPRPRSLPAPAHVR